MWAGRPRKQVAADLPASCLVKAVEDDQQLALVGCRAAQVVGDERSQVVRGLTEFVELGALAMILGEGSGEGTEGCIGRSGLVAQTDRDKDGLPVVVGLDADKPMNQESGLAATGRREE